MIGEPVTLLRRSSSQTRDAHGNRAWTYTEEVVERCAIWPTGSTEQVQGQDQTDERITVMFPYGTDVKPVDRAQVRGLLYEVSGIPSVWRSPFTTTTAGVEARLVRVTG